MRLLFLVVFFVAASCEAVNGDTIRDAKPLSADEIEKLPAILESRLTSISQSQMDVLVTFLESDCEEWIKEVLKQLTGKKANQIPVMDLSMTFGELVIADEFKEHLDPVIRFISNIYILKTGRLDAADRLYALIDDNSLSEFDARYLKTRFAAIGIHVETANAEKIAKHMANLVREFPLLSIGESVPDFEFTDISGHKFSLSGLRGKTVIIHYWATWCGPCIEELESLSKKLALLDKDKYLVVFASLDYDLESHTKYIERLPREFVYVCDGKSASSPITSSFAVINIPRNIVISPEGKLAAASLSELVSDDSEDAETRPTSTKD